MNSDDNVDAFRTSSGGCSDNESCARDLGGGDALFQYNEYDVNVFFEKVLFGVGNTDLHLQRLGEGLRKACEENNLLQVIRGTLHLAVLYQAEKTGSSSENRTQGDVDVTSTKSRRQRRRKIRRHCNSTTANNVDVDPLSYEQPSLEGDADKLSTSSDSNVIGELQGKGLFDVEYEESSSSRLPEDIEIDPDSVSETESDEDLNSSVLSIEDFDIFEDPSGKKHKCHICKKEFRKKAYLKIHLRVHTGERPFPCLHPGCGRAFRRKDTLVKHAKVHGGPFMCPCGKLYIRKSNMSRHRKRCFKQ